MGLNVNPRFNEILADALERQKAEQEAEHIADVSKMDTISRQAAIRKERKTFCVIDILTGEEADTYEIALNEDWAKDLMYCDMEGFAIEEDGSLILVDECGKFEYCPIGRFEVVWDE